MADSLGEAAALDVDDDVVLAVLLVELLAELLVELSLGLVVPVNGFSPVQPTPTNPMTTAVPAAPIANRCLTLAPFFVVTIRSHNMYAVEPAGAANASSGWGERRR